MNDAISLTITLAAPVLAALSLIVSLIRSRHHPLLRRILGGGCVALAVGLAMLLAPFVWELRDGFAPGMVVSKGGSAITRFAFLYAFALLPVGALAFAAWALLRTPHKKETHAA
jgi:hypothetical protein